MYYCHELKGSPEIALPQSDRLLQAGFGSKKVLTKHVHFCNCRRNSDLPADGDSIQQGLPILVNYSWGETCSIASLPYPPAAPRGKTPFYLFPLRCEQHLYSRSGKLVTNRWTTMPTCLMLHHCTFTPLTADPSPGTMWLVGTQTMGLCWTRDTGTHGKATLRAWGCRGGFNFSSGLLSWAPPQEERPLAQLPYSWTRKRDHRELPQLSLYLLEPTCFPLPGDTTILQVTSRDGALQQCSCTAGQWHWGALTPH